MLPQIKFNSLILKSITILAIMLITFQSFKVINDPIIKKLIKLNSSFTIQVKANASTGYSWSWQNESACNNVKIAKKNYKTDCKDPKMVGCGGTETYFFKGIKKGVDTVKMIYSRSWDASSIVDTRTIIVTVK